jgi:hypothetical protein
VDSIFMMPHLGVLAQVNPVASQQVFDRDCMIYLGSCVAPRGQTRVGDPVLEYNIAFPDGRSESGTLKYGEMKLFSNLGVGEEATVEAKPAGKKFDVGDGAGRALTRKVRGGVVGLVLDGRGRALGLSADDKQRAKQLIEWGEVMGSYTNLERVHLEAQQHGR